MLAALLAAALLTPAGAVTPDRKYYFEDIYAPFFAPDPAKPGYLHSVRPGSVASSFAAKKTLETFRVFLIGGSTTGGYHGPRDLEDTLPLLLPSKTVEVVNCGMTGYDSFREGLVLDQVLKQKPDAIVFISGHNEFFINRARPVPLWQLKLQDFFGRWAWYRRLQDAVGAKKAPSLYEVETSDKEERLAEFERVYRQNLKRAAASGAAVIAVIPPVNYADDPPLSDPPWKSRAFMDGWAPYLRGDAETAARRWTAELPKGGEARSYILFYLKRFDEALDGAGYNVCGESCRQVIRRLAGQTKATLAEADDAFKDFDSPALPGLDMFGDEIHWAKRHHGLVSLAIVDALRKAPRLEALPWDETEFEKVQTVWRFSSAHPGPPDLAAEEDHVLFYAAAGFTTRKRFVWQSATWLEHLCRKKPGLCADPNRLLQRLTALDVEQRARAGPWVGGQAMVPPRGLLLWHLGEVHLRLGDKARAKAELTEAAREYPGANLDLALADPHEARGKLARARDAGFAEEAAAFAGALGLSLPSGHDAVEDIIPAGGPKGDSRALLAAAEDKNRSPEARAAAASAALKLKPSFADRGRLAGVYLELRRPEDAHEVFLGLAKDDPKNPGSWTGVAMTAVQLNRKDEARAALTKAEKLSPRPQARHEIAIMRQELGDYAESEAALSGLIKEDPGRPQYYRDRAIARHLAGRTKEGLEDLHRALELEPGLLSAYLTMASVYESQGKLGEALSACEQALKVEPAQGEQGLRPAADRFRLELLSRKKAEK